MAPRILEREHELRVIAAAAASAEAGCGSVLLVSGEAGIGKSRLVAATRAQLPPEGRLLVGHCDDLATPRPLGPFRDLSSAVGAGLRTALVTGADHEGLLRELWTELDRPGRATVLAVEDVHWADHATLDLLHYLVRRVTQLPVVLLLTYRDGEVSRDHPLRRLLGLAAGSPRVRRLPLAPLSATAVSELCAGAGLADAGVHALTAGNPVLRPRAARRRLPRRRTADRCRRRHREGARVGRRRPGRGRAALGAPVGGRALAGRGAPARRPRVARRSRGAGAGVGPGRGRRVPPRAHPACGPRRVAGGAPGRPGGACSRCAEPPPGRRPGEAGAPRVAGRRRGRPRPACPRGGAGGCSQRGTPGSRRALPAGARARCPVRRGRARRPARRQCRGVLHRRQPAPQRRGRPGRRGGAAADVGDAGHAGCEPAVALADPLVDR